MEKFEETFGGLLFQHLFKKSPTAKELFGFGKDLDVDSEETSKSDKFLFHAASVTRMLDAAINMVGPDEELFFEMMHSLGEKHKTYGVTPAMLPNMGSAIMDALEKSLKDSFKDSIKDAWSEVFESISTNMVKGMKT